MILRVTKLLKMLPEKSNPITGLDRPLGSQEVEAPRFLDNRHMKVVRLSSLRTRRLYPPGKIPGTKCYQHLMLFIISIVERNSLYK
jgi:hypothetical protein